MDKIFDTSKEAWAEIGISLTQEQYNDLCLINTMLVSDRARYRQTPVHYILLILKTLGLIGSEKADNEPIDISAEKAEQKRNNEFQETFGRVKEY